MPRAAVCAAYDCTICSKKRADHDGEDRDQSIVCELRDPGGEQPLVPSNNSERDEQRAERKQYRERDTRQCDQEHRVNAKHADQEPDDGAGHVETEVAAQDPALGPQGPGDGAAVVPDPSIVPTGSADPTTAAATWAGAL